MAEKVQVVIEAVNKIEGGMNASIEKIKGLGVAIGGMSLTVGAAVTALGGIVKKTAEAGEQLLKFSQMTGISVENLSRMKQAAALTETTLETVVQVTGLFGKALSGVNDEGKNTTEVLTRLGVTARDPYEALLQVSKAFSEMENGTRKSTDAMLLFGRGGREIISFLNQYHSLAKDMKPLFTTEQAEAADRFSDNIATLKHNVEGLAVSIGNKLIPALNNLFAAFGDKSRADAQIQYLEQQIAQAGGAAGAPGLEAQRIALLNQFFSHGTAGGMSLANAPAGGGGGAAAAIDKEGERITQRLIEQINKWRMTEQEYIRWQADELKKAGANRIKIEEWVATEMERLDQEEIARKKKAYADDLKNYEGSIMQEMYVTQEQEAELTRLAEEGGAARSAALNDWLDSTGRLALAFQDLGDIVRMEGESEEEYAARIVAAQEPMLELLYERIDALKEMGFVGSEAYKKLQQGVQNYYNSVIRSTPAVGRAGSYTGEPSPFLTSVMDLLGNITSGMTSAYAPQSYINKMLGGQFTPSNIGAGVGSFLGGTFGGSALGTLAGSILPSSVFASLGATMSTALFSAILPGVGTILGAVLGGVIGKAFEPDKEDVIWMEVEKGVVGVWGDMSEKSETALEKVLQPVYDGFENALNTLGLTDMAEKIQNLPETKYKVYEDHSEEEVLADIIEKLGTEVGKVIDIDPEKLIEVAEKVNDIRQTIENIQALGKGLSSGIKQMIDDWNYANMTLSEQEGFNLSVMAEKFTELTQAVEPEKISALAQALMSAAAQQVAIVQQLKAMADQLGAAIHGTVEGFQFELLDREGKIGALNESILTLYGQYQSETDPAKRIGLGQQLLSNVQTGWSLLSDEEKRASLPYIIEFLSPIEQDMAKYSQQQQEKLDTLVPILQTLDATIQSRLSVAIDKQTAAIDGLVDTLINKPVEVTVSVSGDVAPIVEIAADAGAQRAITLINNNPELVSGYA